MINVGMYFDQVVYDLLTRPFHRFPITQRGQLETFREAEEYLRFIEGQAEGSQDYGYAGRRNIRLRRKELAQALGPDIDRFLAEVAECRQSSIGRKGKIVHGIELDAVVTTDKAIMKHALICENKFYTRTPDHPAVHKGRDFIRVVGEHVSSHEHFRDILGIPHGSMVVPTLFTLHPSRMFAEKDGVLKAPLTSLATGYFSAIRDRFLEHGSKCSSHSF